MTIQDLGSIGELVAAIATVVTIAYLAAQIRASNKIAKAEALQSVLDGIRDRIQVPFYTHPEIAEVFSRGMTEFDELSEQEQRRFYWIMGEWVFQLQHVWQLYEKGLATKVDFDAWLYAIATMVRTGGGAVVWKNMQATLTPTIVTVLNDYLAEHPDTPAFIDLIPMLRYGYTNEEDVER